MERNALKKIRLPADIYDTLSALSDIYGGVGQGDWYTYHEGRGWDDDWAEHIECPVCINGLASFAVVPDTDLEDRTDSPLHRIGLTPGTNDAAVMAINDKKGAPTDQRVSWAEYVRELNIIRSPYDSDGELAPGEVEG